MSSDGSTIEIFDFEENNNTNMATVLVYYHLKADHIPSFKGIFFLI